jgi:large subunit ribosomal protein L25
VSEVRIAAEPRTEFGKGGARRTRRAGKIPAVLYGHGTPPRHVSLPAREFAQAIRQGANTLLTIEVDGGAELALPKSVQRDPIKGTVDHVDLLLVRRGEKVTVDVRVLLVGEPPRDVIVNQEMTTLSLEAEATHLPESVEVSIEGRSVGAAITAGDVVLPEGSTLAGDPDQTVVSLLAAPTAEQLDAELSGTEAAGIEKAASEGEPAAAATAAAGQDA